VPLAGVGRICRKAGKEQQLGSFPNILLRRHNIGQPFFNVLLSRHSIEKPFLNILLLRHSIGKPFLNVLLSRHNIEKPFLMFFCHGTILRNHFSIFFCGGTILRNHFLMFFCHAPMFFCSGLILRNGVSERKPRFWLVKNGSGQGRSQKRAIKDGKELLGKTGNGQETIAACHTNWDGRLGQLAFGRRGAMG